ncbi:hypothetical protein ACFFNY_19570 [Paenibacillus hodogayensis]|uniref:Uncharacterized protein n=1 Tax=Paenibacillus hodogayensis TaxID=279208 RepID=A0ABV5W0B8_9BACL
MSEPLLSWTALRDLLGLLYRHAPAEACDYARAAVRNRYTGLTGWKRAVASLSKQLDHAPDGGSEAFLPLLESSETRDDRFLYAVLRRYAGDRPAYQFREKWSPDQLIRLYVWIHAHSTFFAKTWRGTASDWKQTILGHGFSDNKLQPAHVLRLTRLLPDCEVARHQWEMVRQNYERDTWRPPAMSTLIHMIDNGKSRPITSGEHLLGVVRDSLQAFENDWRRSENSLIPLLWNEQRPEVEGKQKRTAGKTKYAPKDENTLSDVLNYHFSKDLDQRGITFNREVEVHRSQGEESGARLDLKVEVPASSGNQHLRVYIELKGCWHNNLEQLMEEQLVRKYMIPHQCFQGLYVIGWFTCPQWDEKWDYRAGKAPSYSLAEARRRFHEKAEQLSIRYQMHIEAVVLDLSLR